MKLLDKIIIGLMILCILIAAQYYYNQSNLECTSSPLTYGAKQLSEKYGLEFVGSGAFMVQGTSPIVIYFDKNNITIEKNI